MPWPCASCGVETSRSRKTFDLKGRPLREICPHCQPDDFYDQGPVILPSDQKLWTGPMAMPNLYKRGKDDVYRAKDELIADTAALWDKGPTEEARDRKRATRRTEPLSAEELAASIRWGKECLAPIINKLQNQ